MSAEMIEDYDWESDEGEDWESDEAFAETEDSAEDIGERARRRRRKSKTFQPGRGVRGIALRGPDGRVNNARFPTPLATAAETNRGLAKQELARRALEARLNRLEARSRVQQNKDGSVSGLVTLAIGGGLAGYGAIQAVKSTSNGTLLGKWSKESSTKTAALVSATQLVTSGAKLVTNRGYDKGISMAADIFAAAQLAAFTFGSLYEPGETTAADNLQEARQLSKTALPNTEIVLRDGSAVYRVVVATNGERLLWPLTIINHGSSSGDGAPKSVRTG